MTDATTGDMVDNHVGDLEDVICDAFGFTVDVNITESPFSCDNSGRLTKALIRQKAAAPVGLRFYDSTNSKEYRLVLNNTWILIDENTGTESSPVWTTRIKFALATGLPQLAGATDPSDANDLCRKAYVDAQVAPSFPAGTKMLFFQAAAPSGWTKDTTHNDKMIRVVTGTGGGSGGNWTISGLTVSGHTLTVDEIPSHSHNYNRDDGAGYIVGSGSYAKVALSPWSDATSNTGGGNSHNHGLTADGAWRPAYVDCIICTKN